MIELSPSRRIKVLRDSVARKIAAGEVIDRPYAVVRELIDNAVDAGASSVTVSIAEGGIRSIRVVDDGWGMTREDLEACYLPHATSKIENAEDIYNISSLGFRGEALSSIAACGKMKITSSREDGGEGWILDVTRNNRPVISPYRGPKGTIVEVGDIFSSIPGRRKFLKRPSAEASMIRQTFLEKALPFPDIWFRLLIDGELRINLPVSTAAERITGAYPSQTDPKLLFEIHEDFDGFSINGVFANPSLYRRDRRYIHVYVNNRRISEFGLIQAVEYGYSAFLPGGSYPVGFLFLRIDPALVDFNIHPAKREVKFKNLQEIHRNTVRSIQSALEQGEAPQYKPAQSNPASQLSFGVSAGNIQISEPGHGLKPVYKKIITQALTAGSDGPSASNTPIAREPSPDSPAADGDIAYKGQIFSLFLLFEYNGSLYILDQHAAHERILFDSLLENAKASQELLIPLELDVAEIPDDMHSELENAGILLQRIDGGLFLHSVPDICIGMEGVIKNFIESEKGTVGNLKTELFADIACKKAIKDGESLDDVTAVELIKTALRLPLPRCPHGRPVWFTLSRTELYQILGRT